MRTAPAFWRHDGVLARLLTPVAAVVSAVTAMRIAQPGWRAPVPVICCGNATVGGAGKTTVVLDLAERLQARGLAVHILSRGYGGSIRGPHRITTDDSADRAGDEPLLLAERAPTWIGTNRRSTAELAAAAGADILLMDDGLQNPSLCKDLSLLVIDGLSGFGNGRTLPAGPLREPVIACAARCQAAVIIGDDEAGALALLPRNLSVLRAGLVQTGPIDDLRGRRVLAFAGIAVPEKFFRGLEAAGAVVAARIPRPDHQAYTGAEIETLLRQAETLDAVPVTTPKDAVRLPLGIRAKIKVVGVELAWKNSQAIERLLDQVTAVRGV